MQDKKLKLLLPPVVTAQSLPDFSGFYSLDNDGSSLEVYMSKFFNNNRSTFLEKEGKEIAFNVIKSREDINGLISSELNKERRVSFKANKLRLTR